MGTDQGTGAEQEPGGWRWAIAATVERWREWGSEMAAARDTWPWSVRWATVRVMVRAVLTFVVVLAVGPWAIGQVRIAVSDLSASTPAAQNATIALLVAFALTARTIARSRRVVSVQVNGQGATGRAVMVTGRADPAIARHEAAHALVAHALGAKVLSVRATATGDNNGQCTWSTDATGTRFAWMRMTAAVAGVVAVQDGEAAWPGATADLHGAVAAATFIAGVGEALREYDGPLTLDALLEGARAHARRILEQRAVELDALTERLIARGTLTGTSVEEILAVAPAR